MDNRPSILSTLPKELPFDFLKAIADGFSWERVVSTGAFGTVYKGILPDGQAIAVKKLAENSPVAHGKVLTNEIQNIMALHHENVVKMVGYCHEGQNKVVQHNGRYIVANILDTLLCYEHLPLGSLEQNLFGVPDKMNWDSRFKIIKGICLGLLFLHTIPIVHMDLKPENILLGENMVPKIVDFGLSRLFGQEQTRMNTQTVVESFGYMASEYLHGGQISTKSDIYSLGLIILETTTGERNYSTNNEPSGVHFIKNVRKNWKEQRIASEYVSLDADRLQQVKTCIEIGLECVKTNWREGPSMQNILDKLTGRA